MSVDFTNNAVVDSEIYVHVGYLKTGSTFLQKEVFPRMQDVNYIHYNRCPDAFSDVIYSDAYHFDKERTAALFTEQLKPGKNLISHEAFIGGDASLNHFMNGKVIAERLAGLFPNAKILYVIRNQYDLAISLYKQYVHLGGRKNLRNFLRYSDGKFETITRRWMPGVSVNQVDYKPSIDRYAELFGKESTLVLPFESFAKDNAAFVKRLTQWMNIGDVSFSNARQNRGYGSRQIVVARFLNRFLRSSYNESPLIPNVRMPGIGKMDTSLIRRVLQSKLSFALLGNKKVQDEEVKRSFFAYFEQSNKKLNEQYNLQLETMCPGVYF